MLREWIEESEKQEVLDNLYYLQKFLDKLNNDDNWENPHKYIILEYFPKDTDDPFTYVPNVYQLFNLKIDTIEDEIVIFDDGEGILDESMFEKDNPLPLFMFIVDNIIYIGFQEEPIKHITISLVTGYIQIFY